MIRLFCVPYLLITVGYFSSIKYCLPSLNLNSYDVLGRSRKYTTLICTRNVLLFASLEFVCGFNHGDLFFPVIPRANNFETFNGDVAGDFDIIFLFIQLNECFFGMDLNKVNFSPQCNCSVNQTNFIWWARFNQWSNFHQLDTCTRRYLQVR